MANKRCDDKANVVGVTFAQLGHAYPTTVGPGVETATYIARFFAQHTR